MTVKWFGHKYVAPMYEDCPEVPTPVGEHCCHCTERIDAGDNGMVYANGPVAHRECFIRAVSGSIAHQQRRCGCFVPGATCHDPENVSKRAAARAASLYFECMSLPMSQRAKLRPPYYKTLSPQNQWEIDKRLGILDWDGREELFVVRLWDGMDGEWMDITSPGTWEKTVGTWLEKTDNGTRRICYAEIDYYAIFHADTKMVYSSGIAMHRSDGE